MVIRVGCATWSLNKEVKPQFPSHGTHLERYSHVFNSVEINTSFYRPHRHETYCKWASSTPQDFRFSVKVPKQITHVKRLMNCENEVRSFLAEISGLGQKLGPILLQLPPSLAWIENRMPLFFSLLRTYTSHPVVCEPRHRSWFDRDVDSLLKSFNIARVAADPAIADGGRTPAGDENVRYYRLHGAPRMYYSAYDNDQLTSLAMELKSSVGTGVGETWCIFDNTAENAAQKNAIILNKLLK